MSEDVLRLQVRLLSALPIVQSDPIATDSIVDLSLRLGLTAYDATYRALAIETQLPLATLDRKLAEAARVEGVGILGPLAASPITP
jgi:predicted nucleic acid-binding protein